MEHLKISVNVLNMNREDAIEVVNNIQNKMYEEVTVVGLSDKVVPCYDLEVDEFSLRGDGEPIDIISNKTKRYEFIESDSLHMSVGDAFMLYNDFYSVVHFEDKWFLYSFTSNKVLYNYKKLKTTEELREIINLDYADNNIFYKKI